jgi:putative hydrolase of the HAD superfamily
VGLLKQQGLKVGLISNIPNPKYDVLAAQAPELKDLFDAVIYSYETGHTKPDPAIFQLALTRLNVPAENTVMVGDSLTSDVMGARASGIRALLFDTCGKHPDAHPRATSLAEIPALLHRAEGI